MLTSTADRVRENTPANLNARIDRQILENVDEYGRGEPGAIRTRLNELDREWDIERIIEMEAPLTIIAGLLLGAAVNRKWLIVPFFASSMLLLHGVQGWYPLLPLLRRMGFRTHAEIQQERQALEAKLT